MRPEQRHNTATVDVGTPLFFWQRSSFLLARLKKYFPDCWQQLFVLAVLRAAKGPRFKRLELHYETSFFSYMYPGLSFGPMQLAALLRDVGRRRQAISSFMKEDLKDPGAFILFAGHRLITASHTMPFAERGYDSKHRYLPQINLLYIYRVGPQLGRPVYYKQLIGSTPDVSAFADILRESALKKQDCTVIADKGFASEEDFALLQSMQLHYIISIKRGSLLTRGHIPSAPQDYTDLFTFHGRAIHYLCLPQPGYQLFIFFDAQLYADEMAAAAQRQERANDRCQKLQDRECKRRAQGCGRLTDEEWARRQPQSVAQLHQPIPEMGTVTLRTNRMDLTGIQVYHLYKQRQGIEQFFKTYGDSMEWEASYMRDQETQEAWLFLNHLSSLLGVQSICDLAAQEESKNVSFEDLRQMLGKITASHIDGQWQIAPVKKAVQRLMDKLQLSLQLDDLKKALPLGASAH